MNTVSSFLNRNKYFVLFVLVFAISAVSMAQTAVPVDIEIPVNDTIGYLNDWIAIFAPIFLFIGMIPVALGLLRYITKLFASAFSGGK